MAKRYHTFDCQMYVATKGSLNMVMPIETGPRSVVRLVSVQFDTLADPTFHSLLGALDTIRKPRPFVQVS